MGDVVNNRSHEEPDFTTVFEGVSAKLLDLAHVLVRDHNDCIVSWNSGAEWLYGYSKDEAIGRISHELLQTVFPVSLEAMNESLATTGHWEGELIHTTKDGRKVVVASHQILHRDGTGNKVAVIEVNNDITEQKRAEDALREREEQLSLFIEHAPVALAVFDNEMRYVAASRRWMADYGLTEDVTGRSHYEVFPEISEAWKEVHRRSLAGAVEVAEEDRFVRADGSVQWLHWEVHPWRAAGSAISGIIIFTEDITERKLAQEDRERLLSEVQYHAAELDATLASLADGVVVYDADGNRRYSNAAADRIMQYTPEEKSAEKMSDLISVSPVTWPDGTPLTVEDAPVYRALHGESVHGMILVIHRESGEIWISASAAPIRNSDGATLGAVSSFTDITAQHKAELSLQESERRYRELFETMQEAFFVIEPVTNDQGDPVDWRYVDVNPRVESYLKLPKDQIIGRTYSEIVSHPDPVWIDTLGRAALTGAPVTQEIYSHFADRWLEVNVYSPRPGQAAAFYTDITERREAEEALRKAFRELDASAEELAQINEELAVSNEEIAAANEELRLTNDELHEEMKQREETEEALRRSEEQYRELVQNANSAIIRWKRDGSISFFNEYAQQFFGYSEDEIIGKPVTILVPEVESTGADLKVLVNDIVNRPDEYVSNTNENVRRDGSRVWMAWTNKPVFDENGQVAEIFAVGSDVTGRVRAEQRERELEIQQRDFYRKTILAATGGKLVMTDRDEIEKAVGKPLASWKFGNVSEYAEVRQSVFDLAERECRSRQCFHAFISCVGEMMSNALKHASGGTASICRKDGGVVFCVSDKGQGIEAINLPDVAFTRGYSTAGTGGLGYKLILASAEKVYLSTGLEGTMIAVLVKLDGEGQGFAK